MSTITAILTPDSNGNLLSPLPEEFRHVQVRITARLEAVANLAAPHDDTPEAELSAMAADPEVQREISLIESEFGFAESDGLEQD